MARWNPDSSSGFSDSNSKLWRSMSWMGSSLVAVLAARPVALVLDASLPEDSLSLRFVQPSSRSAVATPSGVQRSASRQLSDHALGRRLDVADFAPELQHPIAVYPDFLRPLYSQHR